MQTASHKLPLAVEAGTNIWLLFLHSSIFQGSGSCPCLWLSSTQRRAFPTLRNVPKNKGLTAPSSALPSLEFLQWLQPWVALLGKPGCHIHPAVPTSQRGCKSQLTWASVQVPRATPGAPETMPLFGKSNKKSLSSTKKLVLIWDIHSPTLREKRKIFLVVALRSRKTVFSFRVIACSGYFASSNRASVSWGLGFTLPGQ